MMMSVRVRVRMMSVRAVVAVVVAVVVCVVYMHVCVDDVSSESTVHIAAHTVLHSKTVYVAMRCNSSYTNHQCHAEISHHTPTHSHTSMMLRVCCI